jgi:hypothetical protein
MEGNPLSEDDQWRKLPTRGRRCSQGVGWRLTRGDSAIFLIKQ